MVFWRHGAASEIKKSLRKLDKSIARIKTLKGKKDHLLELIVYMRGQSKILEKEIKQRVLELQTKPWIGAEFDDQLVSFGTAEIFAVEKLMHELTDYQEFLTVADSDKDIGDILDALTVELQIIEDREAALKNKIISLEKDTLRLRAHPNLVSVPAAMNTKDGLSWRNIVAVSRSFGGWLEAGGGQHAAQIIFPNGNRPIPISGDVHSGRIATQIIAQLNEFLPAHKIPSKSALNRALSAGDIHRAG